MPKTFSLFINSFSFCKLDYHPAIVQRHPPKSPLSKGDFDRKIKLPYPLTLLIVVIGTEQKRLNTFTLAVLLVSVDYGVAFTVGIGEKALTFDFGGSLYGVSIAVGQILILPLALFYWSKVEQIWTLLGDRYGQQVKIPIALMYWTSMIGLESVQILAGAFLLKILGLPLVSGIAILAFISASVSLLPVERAGNLFQILLLLNFCVLFYSLWVLDGIPIYFQSPIEFVPSLENIRTPAVLSIFLPTVGLLCIDMSYQQYLVQAKDKSSLYLGCILAALLMLVLTFLPSALVIAGKQAGILPQGIDGKEAIPYILAWIGGGTHNLLAIAFILTIFLSALGICSNMFRILTKTVLDFKIVNQDNPYVFLIPFVHASLAVIIALKGGALVNLIASFAAAYVSAAFIPLICYFIESGEVYTFSPLSIRMSAFFGSISALIVLFLTIFLADGFILDSAELSIMIIGIGFSCLGLLMGLVVDKYLPVIKKAAITTIKSPQ